MTAPVKIIDCFKLTVLAWKWQEILLHSNNVAKRLRPNVDLVLFMFLIFLMASIWMLLYIVVLSGQEYELSFDPVIGVFGWVNMSAEC